MNKEIQPALTSETHSQMRVIGSNPVRSETMHVKRTMFVPVIYGVFSLLQGAELTAQEEDSPDRPTRTPNQINSITALPLRQNLPPRTSHLNPFRDIYQGDFFTQTQVVPRGGLRTPSRSAAAGTPTPLQTSRPDRAQTDQPTRTIGPIQASVEETATREATRTAAPTGLTEERTLALQPTETLQPIETTQPIQTAERATETPESTLRPTQERTFVEVVYVPETSLSRIMEGYPRSVRFTTIHGTPVNYRFNWNTATALNGTTGAILEPGLYEERPRPIDPSIMNTPSDTTHNGVLPEWNYMSGQVAMIDSGFVYLVVPLRHLDEMGLPLADQPATPRFGIFELSYPKNSNNICRPVDENGTLIPLPTGVIGDGANGVQLGNSVRSPEPMNGYNDMTAIMLAADGRSFTVPTVNGPITVEAGTMMAVEYASNAVAINPSYGSDNNGRTPDQMIAAYMDDTLHLGAWGSDRAMLLVNDIILAAPAP